jgi:GNAT superfamily N-acetyltransferase
LTGELILSTGDIRELVKVRAGQPGDRSYVIRSWISSYNHSPIARALANSYYASYAPVIERQLARSQVRVACLPEEMGAILGFAVVEPERNTVHYVCVRSQWRKKGIASLLLDRELGRTDIRYTHSCPPYVKAPQGWTFAPLSGIFE